MQQKRVPVYTDFSDLDKPTWDNETLTKLADRLVISDDHVCPKCYHFSCEHEKKPISIVLVEGHMRLSIKVIGGYLLNRNNTKRSQDIIGEAMLAIVDAVNKIKQGRLENHDYITAYIIKTVHGFISKFCCNDHTMRVPDRTYFSHGKKYKFYQHALITKTYDLDDDSPSIIRVKHHKALQTRPEYVPLEVLEILDIISETEEDKLILKLKSEGRTLIEIAEILDINKTLVFRKLKIMKTRYESLNNG